MREPLTDSKSLKGYTLVEVLVVVAIMGILSSMGVVGLQGAVQNSRIKDAALNTTAFLERVANEANRISSPICIKKVSDQQINAYKSSTCGSVSGDPLFTFTLESSSKFITSCGLQGSDWLDASGTKGVFKPKLGLSAAPTSGHICIQYGSKDLFGGAQKVSTENAVRAMWKVGNSWSNL